MIFKITKKDWDKIKDILEHEVYKDKKYEVVVDDLEDDIKGLEFSEIDLYTNYSKFRISEETEEEVSDLIEELEDRILSKKYY